MPPSKNDVISGINAGADMFLEIIGKNFCRSGQSNPRFASNLSRLESWTGGSAPGKLDVARAASADQAHCCRPGLGCFAFIRPIAVLESPEQPMLPLCDHGRRVDLDIARISKKIRDRDSKIKLMARRKKRRRLVAVAAHGAQPVEQQFKNLSPSKGGSSQRERNNIDRFLWISRSTAGPRRRKRNKIQRTGRRSHLLHGRARCEELSKR